MLARSSAPNPNFVEFRDELTRPAIFEATLFAIPNDWVEQRGGRILPAPEFARLELRHLTAVSRRVSAQAITTHQLLLPTPRQLARIEFDRAQGCWNLPTHTYTGKHEGHSSYGSLTVLGIEGKAAHRTMYQVFFGIDSLPNGPEDKLDHICENKACCYPRHLDRVTGKENTRRGGLQERFRTGSAHPRLDLPS